MDGTHYALLLGATTLAWMGAGLAAVLDTKHELRSGDMTGKSERVALCIAASGVLSVVAMAVTRVWS